MANTTFNKKVSSLLGNRRVLLSKHIEYLNSPHKADLDPEQRLEILKRTLQYAVELEFGTIPAYLTALWSIKNNLDPVAKSIRNVVQEEMLHLALACNMLSSIGGRPKLYDTENGLRYPTKLPGGVHPELTLKLSGLTDDALDDFLEIELPNEEITLAKYESKYKDAHDGNHSDTIGALYNSVRNEFKSLQPAMTPDKQVSGPLAWFVVDTVEKLDSAIDWILEQGEGAVNNDPNSKHGKDGVPELSHFYRFWEVRKRQKIELDPKTGKYAFGSTLDFPDVWPVAEVPEGGYKQEDVSEAVWELIHNFDLTYSKMIATLESAWGEGGQAGLWKAIDMMFDLEKYARPLMQIPIPGGKGNYGPCFRLIKF